VSHKSSEWLAGIESANRDLNNRRGNRWLGDRRQGGRNGGGPRAATEAKLVLLSAYTDSGHRTEGGAAEIQWATSNSARCREILSRLEADLSSEGITCATKVAEGEAAEVLVELASECEADLLVIGNKGMERRVLGSVPNTVTHTAPCSVLVVKTT